MTPTSDPPTRARLSQQHLSLPERRGTQIQRVLRWPVCSAPGPRQRCRWRRWPGWSPPGWPPRSRAGRPASGAPGLPDRRPDLAVRARAYTGTPRTGDAPMAGASRTRSGFRAASPEDRSRGGWAWLLVVPLILASGSRNDSGSACARRPRHGSLPGIRRRAGLLLRELDLVRPDVAMGMFNTVLGEELLFRGLLLPRMRACSGRGLGRQRRPVRAVPPARAVGHPGGPARRVHPGLALTPVSERADWYHCAQLPDRGDLRPRPRPGAALESPTSTSTYPYQSPGGFCS